MKQAHGIKIDNRAFGCLLKGVNVSIHIVGPRVIGAAIDGGILEA